ncbi:MAG: radical SAM family RiPP maturation amino acid epimerase [Proteobacteria bacterium]|nr:radical SAM family RiPP maturation amino acid epimerase [Pseudomonadota bacterium]
MVSNKINESVFKLFRDKLSALSEVELKTIAHTKRLIERIYGDSEFLDALRKHPDRGKEFARGCGADIDPQDLASVWDRSDPLPLLAEDMGDSPLAKMWAQWTSGICNANELMRSHGDTPEKQPRFHAWRQRQSKRCESELGGHSKIFSYPLFAFELSDGCSMGCPFCGVSAKDFKGAFERTEQNTKLWRLVLEAVADLFGDACQTSVCYWATEPMDNPHYLDYIKDFHEIIGELPQTTTAAPLRNVQITRELLNMQNRFHAISTRFSVLSTSMLRRIHDNFTPEELVNARLLLYNKPLYLKKARAGRHLYSNADPTVTADGSTIACMSGFVVNMATKKIKLISPCPASEKWPSGYKVFFEGTFINGDDFRQILKKVVSENISSNLENDKVLKLRQDLKYHSTNDGICFSSKYRETSFSGHDFLKEMGDMIASGEMNTMEINRKLLASGADYFAVIATLQSIFQNGIFDDAL